MHESETRPGAAELWPRQAASAPPTAAARCPMHQCQNTTAAGTPNSEGHYIRMYDWGRWAVGIGAPLIGVQTTRAAGPHFPSEGVVSCVTELIHEVDSSARSPGAAPWWHELDAAKRSARSAPTSTSETRFLRGLRKPVI